MWVWPESILIPSQYPPPSTPPDEAKECTDYARARRLIELVLAQSQVIMARPSEKDIEGSYQVLISLLERLTDAADLPVMVAAILKDLRASSEDKPGLRLKLLCNFYNLLKSGSPERFSVLLALIEYARDTKQVRWVWRWIWGVVRCMDRWSVALSTPHYTTHHPATDRTARMNTQTQNSWTCWRTSSRSSTSGSRAGAGS